MAGFPARSCRRSLGEPRGDLGAHRGTAPLGYDIEASPHLGYRLLELTGCRCTPTICCRASARPRVIGRDIRVFQETTSTNDVIEKLARDGVKEGVVVFAESQTKGRGRLGRKWMSPAQKGLWFSVLLRPDLRPQEATQLTVAAATALRRAIESQTGLKPEIKWPNDILIRGQESRRHSHRTERGTGPREARHPRHRRGRELNAERFPTRTAQAGDFAEDRSWASPFRGPELAVAILRELDEDYARICAGRFARWRTSGRSIARRSATRWSSASATARFAAAPNRWAKMARCCCAPSTGTWSASSAATVTLEK